MPNPKGSKLLYLPRYLVDKFPLLETDKLQCFLLNMDKWTQHLSFNPTWNDFATDQDNEKIIDALKAFKVI